MMQKQKQTQSPIANICIPLGGMGSGDECDDEISLRFISIGNAIPELVESCTGCGLPKHG